MIHILVRLEVRDFNALDEFEHKAAAIMKKYQGRIVSAFEITHNEDGTGEEIHILEFTDDTAFANYRADSSLAQLADLRSQAISNTQVLISTKLKFYEP